MLSMHTCVSTLALSIRVLASAIKPLMAQPLKKKESKKKNPGREQTAA